MKGCKDKKNKPVLKVIKGDEKRCAEVIKILESMGGKNSLHFLGNESENYYFINMMNNIDCCSIDWTPFFDDFELEIIELPDKVVSKEL